MRKIGCAGLKRPALFSEVLPSVLQRVRKRQTWDRVDRYERIVVERIEAFHHY